MTSLSEYDPATHAGPVLLVAPFGVQTDSSRLEREHGTTAGDVSYEIPADEVEYGESLIMMELGDLEAGMACIVGPKEDEEHNVHSWNVFQITPDNEHYDEFHRIWSESR